jgi:hypothetical protein
MSIEPVVMVAYGERYVTPMVSLEEDSPDPPPSHPVPVPEPTSGTRVLPGDTFVYVVHDDLGWGQARTLVKQTIQMTNELYAAHRYYYREDIGEYRVDQYSKFSFWPEDLKYGWDVYFFNGMTSRQHELFNTTGFGWRDNKANALLAFLAKFFARLFQRIILGIRPPGVNIYNFLLTGGSFLRKAGVWRQWTLFECQDTNEMPEFSNYHDAPDRWFLQGVCGHNADKVSYYGKVNPSIGRLGIPTACPGGIAAIETQYVREVPALPFSTVLDGVKSVNFVELCFQGSQVFGLTDDNEWYYILEQVGHTGGQHDFVLHIPPSAWVQVLPIPTLDWQKE